MWKLTAKCIRLSACFPTEAPGSTPKKTVWLRRLLPKIIRTCALWKVKSEKTKLTRLSSAKFPEFSEYLPCWRWWQSVIGILMKKTLSYQRMKNHKLKKSCFNSETGFFIVGLYYLTILAALIKMSIEINKRMRKER